MIRNAAWMRIGGLALGLALGLAAPAAAVTITEFPAEAGAPAGKHRPFWIAASPDGTLWYTSDGTTPSVRHITLQGEPLSPIVAQGPPVDLTFDPTGRLWWVELLGGGYVIRLRQTDGALSGVVLQGSAYTVIYTSDVNFPLRWGYQRDAETGVCAARTSPFLGGSSYRAFDCKPASVPATRLTGFTVGADGRLWVVAPDANRVYRLAADMKTVDLPVEFPNGSLPTRATLGADGNLWVLTFESDRVYRVTPSGSANKFVQLPAGRGPNSIVSGPDGALWFTEFSSNSIGRLTLDGQYTSYPVPTANARPYALTFGADGALWFTEHDAGQVGRLVPDPPAGGGGGGGPGGGGAGGGVDTFAPRFTGPLAFVPGRFRRGTPAPATIRPRRSATGSFMRFTLSEAATVTFALSRQTSGRRVGRSCLAPTRARRLRPRCVRYVAAGTLARQALQGFNGVAFTGRINGRLLPLGSYRASAVARDAAGNRSTPSVATFTLLLR